MKTDLSKKLAQSSYLFSLEQLNRIGNNDEVFTIQMLSKFAQQVSACSGSIKAALANNDWAELKKIAHKNVPAYAIMHSTEVVELLKYIESNAGVIEEHHRIRNFAILVCTKNDAILMAVIDCIELMRWPKLKHNYQYN